MLDVCRELCGGTLEHVLDRGERLPERSLRIVAQRVLAGLRNMETVAELHHYDLKPANVGLLRAGDYESTVVFDFGSALPLGAVETYFQSACPPRVINESIRSLSAHCYLEAATEVASPQSFLISLAIFLSQW